ncbi:probable disease resistance protein At5g66900 isoform X1 [Malania oleifera]|uniref:probable disease resistance protein At5g66900 isoform X1 n=1 Tax=Malania oleifera TaxID=397392 RepID=UPI0025AE7212|nr:probable disease resistance protein At5g66900 isoform X1 [Malania oleifera]
MDVVAGAALGTAFNELYTVVVEVGKGAIRFKPTLKRLESTLRRIGPTIKEISEYNRLLDRPEEETAPLISLMKEGETLVRKCAKVRWWHCCKKPPNTRRLRELEDRLEEIIQVDFMVFQCRDNKEILHSVKELDRKVSGSNSQSSFSTAAGGIPEPPAFTVGLDVPREELKLKLLKEDMQIIVLSAPGGCGKTTLAKMLCGDKDVKEKFKDNIFFVTVSNTPNVKVIVQKIYQHKGYPVPYFQNDEDAINQMEQLFKAIRAVPVLVVLDDVWSGSEDLLQKFESRIPEHKILVTSRFSFPRFNSTYKLKLLNDQDAMTLFTSTALQHVGNSYTPDDELVNKMVKGCRGFPLAIKVIGSALCGQPEEIWKTRMMELSDGQSIFESDSNLLDCLQISLDVLDRRTILRECFLDLGSFPEDQRIHVPALIDMWTELYELDDDGVQTVANIHKLSARNLANLVVTGEADGCYNEYYVTQHDLLRELAIHLSSQEPIELRKRLIMDLSGNNLPKWWKEQKQQPISARLLSISTDETFSGWYDLQLPEVEVLVLNFCTKSYTLPDFMLKIGKLKVLVITNYGFWPAKLIKFPLLCSLSNLKSIRLEHVLIPSLRETTVQLMNLKKVSLVMCEIGEAFENYGIQIHDMFPNLVEINIDYCKDLVKLPAQLCDIFHLKKLSITNCHMLSELPEEFGKLANLEMLRLRACAGLLELPGSIGNLHKLSFLDLSECFSIGTVPEEMGELCNLRMLHMRGCSSLCELPPSFEKLVSLKGVICDEETASLWDSIHIPGLQITVSKENVNLNFLHNPQF